MPYDLLIKGGRVIDPAQGIDALLDVAIQGHLMAAVAPGIPASQATAVYDARGKIVTPGLIDLNTHINWGTLECVDPDLLFLTGAVTTNVDAGTVGARDFLQFKTFIAQNSRSRVLAFINASFIGMLWAPEYFDSNLLTVTENDRLFMKPPEELIGEEQAILKGVTMRVFGREISGERTLQAVYRAKDVALMAGTPLMLQIHSGAESLSAILDVLTAGDIVSGVFGSSTRKAVFSDDGAIRPEVARAQERGVLFDVGHGRRSFDFRVAADAMRVGLVPDTISSGLNGDCIAEVVCDLPTTLSKFLYLGMSLPDVIERATANPAKIVGMTDQIGSLRSGSIADVSILELAEGAITLQDGAGNSVCARQALKAAAAFCKGALVDARADVIRSRETWIPR
jgi:dihydroorotase